MAGVRVLFFLAAGFAFAPAQLRQPPEAPTGGWFCKAAGMSTYAGTRTVRELWALYARGGVVGGSSAGARTVTSFGKVRSVLGC